MSDYIEETNIPEEAEQVQLEKNRKTRLQKTAFHIMLTGLTVMVLVAALSAIIFSIIMVRFNGSSEAKNYEKLDKHYVFITDDTEKEFWDQVYAGAQEQAELTNVYVERLADNLSDEYSTKELLRVAINSSVDGIIFCGNDDKETVELIDKAVENGIFVVTLRQDIDDSDRQCFVGMNSYDLGIEYGKQILKALQPRTKLKHKICILMEETTTESRQNIIMLAIQEVLSAQWEESLMPEIEIKKIRMDDAFSAEEAIRDIFMDEQNLPDVMVCLNSIYTQCTYQAAVDYNQVGDVKIIGYYSTDDMLEAIQKQIVYSAIRVETEEMGRSCIKALKEYEETGYTNSYVPVNTMVIGKSEAGRMLDEKAENEDAGN